MKDNFSTQSDKYAQFRPTYPEALYSYLLSIVPGRDNAWDCGTGNGQVAQILVQSFKKVFATDISRQQIGNAREHDKIEYSVQPAEKTSFPDDLGIALDAAGVIYIAGQANNRIPRIE